MTRQQIALKWQGKGVRPRIKHEPRIDLALAHVDFMQPIDGAVRRSLPLDD